MKLLTVLPLTFILLLSSVHAQTAADSVIAGIPLLLTPGRHLIHYIRATSNENPTQLQKSLQAKMFQAMMKHGAWFRDTLPKLSGSPEELADAMKRVTGITDEQWKEYTAEMEKKRTGYELYGEDTLEIIPRGKLICFQGSGNAANLDSLQIDLATNVVLFKQYTIPFDRIRHNNNPDNPMHSIVDSYDYKLDRSSLPDTSNPTSMHLESYEFHVMRFPTAGKTAIAFMVIKVDSPPALPSRNIALVGEID